MKFFMDTMFATCPFICTLKLGEDLKPFKLYYLGYRDCVGVILPPGDPQIWPIAWAAAKGKGKTGVIEKALRGKFVQCRHNIRLKKRAKKNGTKFYKEPVWQTPPKKETTLKKTDKLPIRRRKRERRKLILHS